MQFNFKRWHSQLISNHLCARENFLLYAIEEVKAKASLEGRCFIIEFETEIYHLLTINESNWSKSIKVQSIVRQILCLYLKFKDLPALFMFSFVIIDIDVQTSLTRNACRRWQPPDSSLNLSTELLPRLLFNFLDSVTSCGKFYLLSVFIQSSCRFKFFCESAFNHRKS